MACLGRGPQGSYGFRPWEPTLRSCSKPSIPRPLCVLQWCFWDTVFPMCHIVDWLLADFIPLSDSLWLTLPHFSSQENGIESVFLLKKEKKVDVWLTSLYKTSWSQTLLSFLSSIFFIFSFPGHFPLRTLSRMSDLLIRIRELFECVLAPTPNGKKLKLVEGHQYLWATLKCVPSNSGMGYVLLMWLWGLCTHPLGEKPQYWPLIPE